MSWPERQILEALGPEDRRPGALRSLPYAEIQLKQCQRYYRLIYALARDLRPNVYVELGVGNGWACQHVRIASPRTQIIAVDLTFDLTLINLDGIDCFESDSIEAAPFVAKAADAAGLIFFDSCHDPNYLKREFATWDPLCAPGCVQLFDDVGVRYMRKGWKGIPDPKRKLPALHQETGFGIRVKPLSTGLK